MSCTNVLKTGANKGNVCGRTRCHYHTKKSKVIIPTTIEHTRHTYRPAVSGILGSYDLHTVTYDAIFENQLATARKVVEQFLTFRFVVLVSQCQAGKTGAAKAVVKLLSNKHRYLVPIVIVPMNDNDILAQTRREFSDVPHDNIMTQSRLLDPNAVKNIMNAYPEATFLIIVDESHCCSNMKEGITCLYKNLRNAGIYPNGSSLPSNVYYLSVSATPNAEFAGMNHFGTKAKVILETAQAYYGIGQMFELDRVHESHRLTPNDSKIIEILNKYKNQKKYAIVRMPNETHFAPGFRDHIKRHFPFAHILNYTSKHSIGDISRILQTQPDCLTIILIVHRCRASMQLRTNYVCMVFENASAETDITTQGLPGRCCGMHKEADAVDIYCNVDALKTQLNWINSGYSEHSVPQCKSITGGVSTTESATDFWESSIPKCGVYDVMVLGLLGDALRNHGPNSLTSEFYRRNEDLLNRYCRPQEAHPIKGSGVTIIREAGSTYTKFWASKTEKVRNGIPHHGFDVSSLDRNSAGYYMYIIMIEGHADYGKYRIYYTRRKPEGSCRTAASEPVSTNLYHHGWCA